MFIRFNRVKYLNDDETAGKCMSGTAEITHKEIVGTDSAGHPRWERAKTPDKSLGKVLWTDFSDKKHGIFFNDEHGIYELTMHDDVLIYKDVDIKDERIQHRDEFIYRVRIRSNISRSQTS